MENYKKTVQISDKDYARYLKNAEEMERLILAAEISCKQIEKIRKQPLGKIGRVKRIRLAKLKNAVRILVE